MINIKIQNNNSKLVIVQIMISQFIYLFFCFENYKFIIQRLWTSKVLKERLETFFFFFEVFGVSFMLGRTFQFRKYFLILPNFPHQTFSFWWCRFEGSIRCCLNLRRAYRSVSMQRTSESPVQKRKKKLGIKRKEKKWNGS